MSKDSRKAGKPQKPRKGASSGSRARRTPREEEVVEPEELADHEEDREGGNFGARIEIDIEDEDDDRRSSRRRGGSRDNPFGPDGVFGPGGPLGPDGPFGPGGFFGPQGVFGPGGLFAMSGRQHKRARRYGEERGAGMGRERTERGRRRRMFGPGELRLVLLAMLAEEPRHGYELIKALEEMTAGAYAPSPGTVYPTLQMLADEGVIAEKDSEDARKLYQATDAGIAELEDRKSEIEDLWQRLGRRRERERPSGSGELFRAMGNLGSVLKNKAASGELKGMDKDKVVDLIDELARKIERL